MKKIFSCRMMLVVIPLLFCVPSAFGMLPSKLTPLIGLAAKRAASTARVGLKSLTIKNPVTPTAIRSIMTSQVPQSQCGRCTMPISSLSRLGTVNYLSNASRLDSAQILKLVHEQRRNFSSSESESIISYISWALAFLFYSFISTIMNDINIDRCKRSIEDVDKKVEDIQNRLEALKSEYCEQKEAEAKQQQHQADRIKIAGAATAAIKFS